MEPDRRSLSPARHGLVMLLLAVTGMASAAESASDRLQRASETLARFVFDLPQADFRAVRSTESNSSPAWQQATFGLAVCLQHATPASAEALAEAKSLYGELAAQAPDSPWAPRAVLNLGRIAELRDHGDDVPNLAEARTQYQRVMDDWTSDPIAGEAALRLASAWSQECTEAGRQKSIAVLEAWIAGHPQDPLLAGHWQYLGDRRFDGDELEKALIAYTEADRIGLLLKGREQGTWWKMASIAKELGKRDEAITWYTRICEKSQTSGFAFDAQREIALLGAPVPELDSFATTPWKRPRLPGEPAPGGSATTSVEAKP